MINERKLAERITKRCFEGTKIAEENDIPDVGSSAPTHVLLFIIQPSWQGCSTPGKNNVCQEGRIWRKMTANVLKKALTDCGKGLPELEGIKELGWNVFSSLR